MLEARPSGELFAVTGRPVAHSRSPQLFRAAFEALGLPHRYLRMVTEDASEAERLAGGLGLAGWNATAPYKSALAERFELAGLARQLGAVNTVVPKGDGWRGLNTDGAGVTGALSAGGLSLAGCRAVVLGAGGAGRAAAAGLVQAGARVTMVNRTQVRAEQAARSLGCAAAPVDALPELLASAGLMVACLPGEARVVEPDWLHPGLTVLEADYAHGRLAALAAAAGCKVVDGTEWLLHQALAGFELMLGRPAPAEAMRAGLEARTSASTIIALVGFMGAGKTTLGRALAERLDWGFVDLDEVVTRRAGMGIAELFARRGEPAFRALETEALQDVLGAPRTVIACGGGIVLDENNRGLLSGCLTLWLWCSLAACLRRVDGSARPLLAGTGRAERAAALLAERTALYADCAALVADSEHAPCAELANRVADEVRRLQDH